MRRVFWDELLRRSVGGAYPVSFACYLGGNAVRFSAARFSGDLGYVFQKFAPKRFFRTLLGKIFGCELVLGTFYRALSWFSIWKSLQLLPENPAKSSLLLSFAIFEFSFSKGRRCTEFCGEDFSSILVRFSRLGFLVGV